MEVSYSQLSSQGPVRQNNEDYIVFWQPSDIDDRRSRGAVAFLADGVGGQGDGEVASRLAVETALETFLQAPPASNSTQLLRSMFNSANLAVYDTGMKQIQEGQGRMATTLTITIFRNTEIAIGHVGDCRVYLVSQGRIRRITYDHSYAGMQLKMGLITAEEANQSENRSVLTRTIGHEPLVRMDYYAIPVTRGDRVMQCSDGLYCCLSEGEIYDLVSKLPAADACRELTALAEKRGTEDNLSCQVIHVDKTERPGYYRGVPFYQDTPDPPDKSMSSEPEPGQLFDDRYQITDIVSRSGMATIYKAVDTKSGGTVALKVPLMQYEADPNFFTRFQREEEIGRRLHHPNILRIFPHEEDEARCRPYISMEFLEGQTLGLLLKNVNPLPEHDALKIASRVCEALHYMHEHEVIHRDLKPENIMICNDGSIRIMDFGIAKLEGMRRLTFGGFTPAMGTPDYIAPEQVKGKRGDGRTDIYSLGALLYEMVTGVPPFEGSSPFVIMNARLTGDPTAPRKRNPKISPQVEEIILHAMERSPIDRYPNAKVMKEELDHPETVQMTGRADRLQAPTPWKSGWGAHRLTILAIALPIVAIAIFWLITHLHISLKN